MHMYTIDTSEHSLDTCGTLFNLASIIYFIKIKTLLEHINLKYFFLFTLQIWVICLFLYQRYLVLVHNIDASGWKKQ